MSSTGAIPPTPAHSSRAVVVAIVVVVIVVVAGLAYYFIALRPSGGGTGPLEAGGFTAGQVVTFVYNGTTTYLCTPSLLTFFPSATQAAAVTNCEVGAANQSAVEQVPQWVLVPAFAGLSIFGVTGLGANDRGFPVYQNAAVLTDCGAGGTATGCVDHPSALYSPLFADVETHLNITNGYGGFPEGVLPTPAHDHLLNTSTTYPNVQWGTIVVLVLDPNIWPDRASGSCSAVVSSNLSQPTGHCLTSIASLAAALTTESSAVATGNSGNPIWETLGSPAVQVVIPGDVSVAEINNLDGNLYIPFAVQPGAPSSFPT